MRKLLAAAASACAALAFAASPGDVLVWNNSVNSPEILSGSSVGECQFDFEVPATDDLPAGSTVKIKKIMFASVNESFSPWVNGTTSTSHDPYMIKLNGVNSALVNGFSAAADVAFSEDDRIKSGQNGDNEQRDHKLEFAFENDCIVNVGQKYAAATGSSTGGAGNGIALLHSNSNLVYSGSTDRATVRYVSLSGGIVSTATAPSGYVPFCKIEAEVVSVYEPPAEADATPDFTWTPAVTASGLSQTAENAKGTWCYSFTSGSCFRAPSATGGQMYDLESTPWANVAARTAAFSFSVYGSADKTAASGKAVIVSFGNNTAGNTTSRFVLYREGIDIKAGFFDGSWNAIGSAASILAPADGSMHLFTCVCDPAAGSVTLYMDGGATSDTASAGGAVSLSAGLQLGSHFGGIGNNGAGAAGFVSGKGFALAKMYGFDRALAAEAVATLAQDNPVASLGVQLSGNVDSSAGNGAKVTVYSTSASGNQYLGITKGTLSVPEGETVTVPNIMILNSSESASSAVFDLAGTVVVTSESAVANVWEERNSNKGVLLGHWSGTGTYNISGLLAATNAYIETVYTAGSQTVNVNGGTVVAKGLYANAGHNDSVVNLSDGGTLDVGGIPSGGGAIAMNLGFGMYKVRSTATSGAGTVTFNAPAGQATVIDPCSGTLTFPAGCTAGSGAVEINASGEGGTVVFMESGFTGAVTVRNGTFKCQVTDSDLLSGKVFSNIMVAPGGELVLLAPDGGEVDSSLVTSAVDAETGMTVYTLAPSANTWTDADGTGRLSSAGNWSRGLPSDGDNLIIQVAGNTEVKNDLALTAGRVRVAGTGTASFADGGSALTVSNLVAETAVVAGGTQFQPLAAESVSGGSLAIGPSGRLDGTVVAYESALPAAGDAFTASTYASNVTSADRWGGTVWLKNLPVTWFIFDNYGNSGSTLRLSGVYGYLDFDQTRVNEVCVELENDSYEYGLYVNDGASRDKAESANKATVLSKLSGSGTLNCGGSAPKAVIVAKDVSEFTGVIGLNNKMLVLGDYLPDLTEVVAGQILVPAGSTVANNAAGGNIWWASGGIKVAGELRATGLDKFGGGTAIATTGDGVFTLLTPSGTVDDADVSYARITGTGKLRYADGGGNNWRTLAQTSFPTGMVCENNLSAGLVLTKSSVIGSLAGSGKIRSDWGSGDRNLRIVQATNTVYSGLFDPDTDDRIGNVIVGPGESSAGTLTISGIQTVNNNLQVWPGARVDIDGKWTGLVASTGALGGSGEISGDLSISDGATIFVSDPADVLNVTGGITASGAITLQFPQGYSLSGAKMAVTAGGTVDISNATFTVKCGDSVVGNVTVGSSGGIKVAAPGIVLRIR